MVCKIMQTEVKVYDGYPDSGQKINALGILRLIHVKIKCL